MLTFMSNHASSFDPGRCLRGCSRLPGSSVRSNHMLDLFAQNRQGNSIADQIDASGDCWEWTGAVSASGYGNKWFDGTWQGVHVLVWESLVGPIPDGMEIDHLCLNTVCCNPDHLEPVTHVENVRRRTWFPESNKTRCPQGHPYAGDNLYVDPKKGGRHCRACIRAASSRYYWKNKTR